MYPMRLDEGGRRGRIDSWKKKNTQDHILKLVGKTAFAGVMSLVVARYGPRLVPFSRLVLRSFMKS